MFLVQCATELLAQGEEEETVYSALAAITKPYSAFPCQTKDELMPAFWVRLLQAYFDAQQSLERQGKGQLLPHPDFLIDMVYNTALRAHTTKVKALLLSTDPYEEKDLTLEIVAALYNKAARIARKQHPGISDALAASAPPKPEPKPAAPQADTPKPKGKAKGKGA